MESSSTERNLSTDFWVSQEYSPRKPLSRTEASASIISACAIVRGGIGPVALSRLVLELIEIQHHIGLTVQFSFKPVESDSHDVPVTNSMAGGNTADVEPYFVNQIEVIFGKFRSMRSEIEVLFPALLTQYPQSHLPARRLY